VKLVWHIVAKDLRRMAVPILLWAVLLVAQSQLGMDVLHGDAVDLPHFDLMGMLIGISLYVVIFVHLVLVAILIHEDAAVGTRMFWQTRPISGGRMLTAKLVAAFLIFGVLPTLISLRWWLACSYGWREISHAALLTLDSYLFVTLLGLVLAVLTDTINRYLAYLVGAVVLFGVWTASFGAVANREATTTALFVFGVCVVLTASAVVVWQFLRREVRRAAILLLLGVFVSSSALIYWRWDFVPQLRGAEIAAPADFTLKPTRATIGTTRRLAGQEALIDFTVTGIPEDVGMTGRLDAAWQWSDDTHTHARAAFQPVWPEANEWRVLGLAPEKFTGVSHRTSTIVMRGQKLGSTATEPDRIQALVWLNEEHANRWAQEPAHFTADTTIEFFRLEPELELPVRAGASTGREGFTLRIASAEWREGLLHVNIVESRRVWATNTRLVPGFTMFWRAMGDDDDIGLTLVDHVHQRRRAIFHGRQNIVGPQVVVGTQRVRWYHLALESPEWMEGATLNLLRTERTAAFHRSVTVDSLPVTFVANP
jgi:hypothetical protein